MEQLPSMTIANRPVPLFLFRKAEIVTIPLDHRVHQIASHISKGRIVLCELDLEQFLMEEATNKNADIRTILAEVADSVDEDAASANIEGKVSTKYRWLADSIESVAIVPLRNDKNAFLDKSGSLETAFVPRFLFEHLPLSDEALDSAVISKDWKANTVDVFELEQRFEAENMRWQREDPSRHMSETGNALAALLGMEDTLSRMKETYLYGYAIGEAVGREHSKQWLAMDLKLEHFIRTSISTVVHVDHSDDVYLFREPTIVECAKSIAPLYQQMSYSLWYSFREGYWDVRGRPALEIFQIFDGDIVGEILGCRCITKATEERRSGNWAAALQWYDCAEAAFTLFSKEQEEEAESYLCSVILVRGDTALQQCQWQTALDHYDSAIPRLMRLGYSVVFKLGGALINSVVALRKLHRNSEADERLAQAKSAAMELPADDPAREQLLAAADKLSQHDDTPGSRN